MAASPDKMFEIALWNKKKVVSKDDIPDEVRVTYRFLATSRVLELFGHEAWLSSTGHNKVAKLVISHLIEKP